MYLVNFDSSLDRCCKSILGKFEDSFIYFFSKKLDKKLKHRKLLDTFVYLSSTKIGF